MSRRPKETKFGEEFQKEGKEVRSPHHVDTSTGGKAEIPEPQTKSDVERIAEGFLDPEDDVGTEEKSLSFKVKLFRTKTSLRAVELNIQDGNLGLEITHVGTEPAVQDRVARGQHYLKHKVNVITPAEAAFYTSGNSNMIKREEIVFIDLRRKEDREQEPNSRIPGAKNWPLNDTEEEKSKWYTEFDMKEENKTPTSRQREEDVQNNWQALYEDQTSAVYQAASNPNVKHVVIHCYLSSSRTPVIARGYWQFMRKMGGRDEATAQKVYLMLGGYRAYSQWVNSVQYTAGREVWE